VNENVIEAWLLQFMPRSWHIWMHPEDLLRNGLRHAGIVPAAD
jgi:hypothetical protein